MPEGAGSLPSTLVRWKFWIQSTQGDHQRLILVAAGAREWAVVRWHVRGATVAPILYAAEDALKVGDMHCLDLLARELILGAQDDEEGCQAQADVVGRGKLYQTLLTRFNPPVQAAPVRAPPQSKACIIQ